MIIIFILAALAVVGLGLYFMSNGIGILGGILIIGGTIFVLVMFFGGVNKAKSKIAPPSKPSYSGKSSSEHSYNSSSESASDYAYKIANEVKYGIRSLSSIYWGSVDSSSSGDKISITMHYSMKNNGYNYVASERDVFDAVGNAVSTAMKKTSCPYNVSYQIVCDEVYTNM